MTEMGCQLHTADGERTRNVCVCVCVYEVVSRFGVISEGIQIDTSSTGHKMQDAGPCRIHLSILRDEGRVAASALW